MARKESEDKSRRLIRTHVELAAAGKIGGGGRRPFGYQADRMTLEPDEAAAIRDAARRVIGGESIPAIVADWRARGIATVTGAPWAPTTVKRLLRSGRIAGQREHEGQITAPAVWPAIVALADHQRLRAILDDRARDRTTRTARRYLLSGFVHCGRCDTRMTTRPAAAGRGRYICAADRGGCGRVGVDADKLHAYVTAYVFDTLDSPAFAAALTEADSGADDDEQLLDTIRTIEADLGQAGRDFYVDHTMSRETFLAGQRGLQAQLAEAQAQHVARNRRPHLAITESWPADRLRGAWADMTLDQRQAVIGEVVDRIIIAPTARTNNRFDPERVTTVPRHI